MFYGLFNIRGLEDTRSSRVELQKMMVRLGAQIWQVRGDHLRFASSALSSCELPSYHRQHMRALPNNSALDLDDDE